MLLTKIQITTKTQKKTALKLFFYSTEFQVLLPIYLPHLRSSDFIKERLEKRYFPVNFANFFKVLVDAYFWKTYIVFWDSVLEFYVCG